MYIVHVKQHLQPVAIGWLGEKAKYLKKKHNFYTEQPVFFSQHQYLGRMSSYIVVGIVFPRYRINQIEFDIELDIEFFGTRYRNDRKGRKVSLPMLLLEFLFSYNSIYFSCLLRFYKRTVANWKRSWLVKPLTSLMYNISNSMEIEIISISRELDIG